MVEGYINTWRPISEGQVLLFSWRLMGLPLIVQSGWTTQITWTWDRRELMSCKPHRCVRVRSCMGTRKGFSPSNTSGPDCRWKLRVHPNVLPGTYAFEVWALKTSPVISSYETEGLNGSVCLSPAEEQLPPPYRIQGMRQIYAAATTSEPYILLVQGICMVGNGRLAKVTGSLKTARLMIDSKNSDNWRQLLNFR